MPDRMTRFLMASFSAGLFAVLYLARPGALVPAATVFAVGTGAYGLLNKLWPPTDN